VTSSVFQFASDIIRVPVREWHRPCFDSTCSRNECWS